MTKFKFNIDQPDPSDDKINRHKDFKKLNGNYQRMTKPLYKTPLYKNPKVFLVLLLILILAYVVAEMRDDDKKAPQGNDSIKPDTVKKNVP